MPAPEALRAQRIDCAQLAGASDGRVLREEAHQGGASLDHPEPHLENRAYVVVTTGLAADGRRRWTHSGRRPKELVGNLPQDRAILHGFPAQSEAEAYWTATGLLEVRPHLI